MGILFILYVLIYSVIGLPWYVCLGVVLIAGVALTVTIYSLSDKYGEHGLVKALAGRQVPSVVRSRTRKVFFFNIRRARK